MSWQAVAWCMNPPKAYGADYLVLLAIAERADKDGRESYGSVEDIARRANLCRFGEIAEPSKRVRENAMRSARRSLAKLEAEGRVEDCGAARRGTRNRRVCMDQGPDEMSVSDEMSSGTVPGVVPEPDQMSGQQDNRSGTPDNRSGLQDDMSVDPDDMSPKPPEEPSPEPIQESVAEPAPLSVPPHTGGAGYPSGEQDSARVAAQREFLATRQYLPAGGLSPQSSGDELTPHQRAAERAEDERELAQLQAQYERKQADPSAHNVAKTKEAMEELRERLAPARAAA